MSYEPGHKSVFSECECYYGDFWVGGGFSELSHQAQHPLGVELMLNLLPPSPCSVTDLRQQWDSPPNLTGCPMTASHRPPLPVRVWVPLN